MTREKLPARLACVVYPPIIVYLPQQTFQDESRLKINYKLEFRNFVQVLKQVTAENILATGPLPASRSRPGGGKTRGSQGATPRSPQPKTGPPRLLPHLVCFFEIKTFERIDYLKYNFVNG